MDEDNNTIIKNSLKGGVRPGAGAKKKADVKKPVSVGLTQSVRQELEILCNKMGCNKSELIAILIHEKYDYEIHSNAGLSNLKGFLKDQYGMIEESSK